MPAAPLFLGIDVGGTNIKAGCVDAAGRALGRASVPTGQADGTAAGLDRIEAAATAALADAGRDLGEVSAVGLATPGPMDLKTGTLLRPSNLPGWRNWAVRDAVAEPARQTHHAPERRQRRRVRGILVRGRAGRGQPRPLDARHRDRVRDHPAGLRDRGRALPRQRVRARRRGLLPRRPASTPGPASPAPWKPTPGPAA